MDLYIFKGEKFYNGGKLSIIVYQKPENKYMYIPYQSAHPRHTIKNYFLCELKTYIQINTEELNFLKLKTSFSLKCVTAGSRKISYHIAFQKLSIHLEPTFFATTKKINAIFRVHEKQRQNLFFLKLQRKL